MYSFAMLFYCTDFWKVGRRCASAARRISSAGGREMGRGQLATNGTLCYIAPHAPISCHRIRTAREYNSSSPIQYASRSISVWRVDTIPAQRALSAAPHQQSRRVHGSGRFGPGAGAIDVRATGRDAGKDSTLAGKLRCHSSATFGSPFELWRRIPASRWWSSSRWPDLDELQRPKLSASVISPSYFRTVERPCFPAVSSIAADRISSIPVLS